MDTLKTLMNYQLQFVTKQERKHPDKHTNSG